MLLGVGDVGGQGNEVFFLKTDKLSVIENVSWFEYFSDVKVQHGWMMLSQCSQVKIISLKCSEDTVQFSWSQFSGLHCCEMHFCEVQFYEVHFYQVQFNEVQFS